ncbi:ARF-GAP domain 15 [Actinidia rufa]|uniref:ARF-GAP domain 15 n=1 Tax=Actinidia rufa TaxID=165716 RepID=A0A7J0GNE9_9ERIC|nr:ARF-GAP domain 15 [Actinidia rufa]
MNQKASVSKELNAKHAKILDGLLKLPENRECADCRSKYASQNQFMYSSPSHRDVLNELDTDGEVALHHPLGWLQDGRALTWGYSYACNVLEYIGVLEFISQRSLKSQLLRYFTASPVYNFGYMAARAAIGNEKANRYWEAELPPNYDRGRTETFIRAKYQEKTWVSEKATPPVPMSVEDSSKYDKVVANGARYSIPKKTRKLSLDEETLSKNMAHVAPTARHRGGSFDMMNKVVAAPPPRGLNPGPTTFAKKSNSTTDLFSLLYAQDSEPNPAIPSRWATFDCKN